jgi:hypothetical protein
MATYYGHARLEPYGSRVVVFGRRKLPARLVGGDGAEIIDLSRDWRVTFHAASGSSPAPATLETLRSWTESEPTRYFSGTAEYEREFTISIDRTPSVTA